MYIYNCEYAKVAAALRWAVEVPDIIIIHALCSGFRACVCVCFAFFFIMCRFRSWRRSSLPLITRAYYSSMMLMGNAVQIIQHSHSPGCRVRELQKIGAKKCVVVLCVIERTRRRKKANTTSALTLKSFSSSSHNALVCGGR